MRKLLGCIFALALAFSATMASADTTYYYTGNAYGPGNHSAAYSDTDFLSIQFTMATPLAPNLNNWQFTLADQPLSWSVNDGVNQFGSDTGYLGGAHFWTDASGAIWGWDFAAQNSFMSSTVQIESSMCKICSVNQDSVTSAGGAEWAGAYPLLDPNTGEFLAPQGSWSTTAPAATPEPASLLLLGTGLLTGVVRKKSRT